jgi:hypothetical protein
MQPRALLVGFLLFALACGGAIAPTIDDTGSDAATYLSPAPPPDAAPVDATAGFSMSIDATTAPGSTCVVPDTTGASAPPGTACELARTIVDRTCAPIQPGTHCDAIDVCAGTEDEARAILAVASVSCVAEVPGCAGIACTWAVGAPVVVDDAMMAPICAVSLVTTGMVRCRIVD